MLGFDAVFWVSWGRYVMQMQRAILFPATWTNDLGFVEYVVVLPTAVVLAPLIDPWGIFDPPSGPIIFPRGESEEKGAYGQKVV